MALWLDRAKRAEKAPFIFLLFIYVLSSYRPLGTIARVVLLREDHLFESISAIFLLSSSILLLISAIKAKSNRLSKKYSNKLLALATTIFIWFAEEISWGQRILNYNIPSLESINYQSETTIHNLSIIQGGSFNFLHYSYFLVFLTAALLCILPGKKDPETFSLTPSSELFYYFFLPAAYYFIGQIMQDIPIEIHGYTIGPEHTHKFQEAYEFLLAAGVLKFSIEKFKTITKPNLPNPN